MRARSLQARLPVDSEHQGHLVERERGAEAGEGVFALRAEEGARARGYGGGELGGLADDWSRTTGAAAFGLGVAGGRVAGRHVRG
jgi:hypothetical protein